MNTLKVVLVLSTTCTSACTFSALPETFEVQKVMVDGEPHLLSQLTASTWTLRPSNQRLRLATNAVGRAELLKTIEKASGCKVADSNYSNRNQQLDAQVDCGQQLQN